MEISIFLSYSHKDEDARRQLEKFLKPLENELKCSVWYDRKIISGDDWSDEIQKKMEMSDIMILFVSQDYIASSACTHEMKFAYEKRDQKSIIPIIIKPSSWQDMAIKSIQALPTDGKPVSMWANSDEAWLDVYEGIKAVLQKKQDVKNKISFLEELKKIDFVSMSNSKALLPDIYVWPGMKNFSVADSSSEDIDASFEVFTRSEMRSIVVRGLELSGKTSLARMIYLEAAAHDYSPILLDGDLIYKTRDIQEIIKKAFTEQYEGEYCEYLKKKKKILLLDNYHHKIKNDIYCRVKEVFEVLIIFISDQEYMMYFREDELFADCDVYSIVSMDRVKIQELVVGWKRLDKSLKEQTQQFDNYVDELENKIYSVTSNNIVPKFPFYILSIIQSFEGFMPADYQITAYGHCYNALITAQLLKKEIAPKDITEAYNYLTHLSYAIFLHFEEYGQKMDMIAYESFKIKYKEKYIIKDCTIKKVEDDEYPLLKIKDSLIHFEQLYLYYYFVGKYLADENEEKKICELCEGIHKKDYAYMLIFTVHHATRNSLIDEIQLHCMVSLDKIEPAKLSTDETEFMNSLLVDIPRKIVNSKTISENRKEQRMREIDNNTEEVVADDESIIALNKSFRIIEVLGQILKNRVGSFEKKRVYELLVEVESLGLRLLNYFLCTLKDPAFAKWIELRLDAKEKEQSDGRKLFSDDEKKRYVEKNIQLMSMLTILSMIKKIYDSVSSEKLLEIQNEITKHNFFPAYRIINLLFMLSYKDIDVPYIRDELKSYKSLKNSWAFKTISLILQHYLNTHHVDFHDRQKIYAALELEYKPNR